ncbi:MAG: alkaline phosphatase D family protein, partial [Cellulosilyticaceae bacterium]
MLKKTFIYILLLILSTLYVSAQGTLLKSGPMQGYSQMKETMIWLQTESSASVYIQYWDTLKPSIIHKTLPITTEKTHAYTAHILVDEIEPSTTYQYNVYINEKKITFSYPLYFSTPTLWRYRSEPPAIKIAVGSCAFINEEAYDRPGKPYGGNYEIFENLAAQKADMMLWLGDNTYYREVDWYSKTGMAYRYTHTRALPQMQKLLSTGIHLAIWDDHDYGPNDSDRRFVGKEISREVFMDFWANPSYGINNQGIQTMYEWADAQFFLMDDRWFRTPNNLHSDKKTYFGEEQINDIIEKLTTAQDDSYVTFKFVCVGGQVLNPAKKYETFANIAASERDSLLARIAREDIRNVIFLSGDRHHSELSSIELTNPKGEKFKVYDWTVSPLTSGVHGESKGENSLQEEGSYYG